MELPTTPSAAETHAKRGINTGNLRLETSCHENRQKRPLPHAEELLGKPAVVTLQRLFVRFDDVNANGIGVVGVPFSIRQALQEDLDETEASAGEKAA